MERRHVTQCEAGLTLSSAVIPLTCGCNRGATCKMIGVGRSWRHDIDARGSDRNAAAAVRMDEQLVITRVFRAGAAVLAPLSSCVQAIAHLSRRASMNLAIIPPASTRHFLGVE